MHLRFDDLRPGREKHFGFAEPQEVLTADELSEVIEVVAGAEASARAGRWVAGFVAYEAAPAFDEALVAHRTVEGLPLVWFGVFEELLDVPETNPPLQYRLSDWTASTDQPGYQESVAAIHRHIAAGDTYQVNYTFRLRAEFQGDSEALYHRLIEAQSGGFGAYLDTGSHVVMSASPELFFRWDENALVTRPMKGTIRRGRWSEEDQELASRLAESEKDRAENLMIVDLLRNDLGRVAEFGSVAVDELFELERYETLWQMTSTIRAVPRSDVALVDVFRALFPSGSVTGAPKVRTTEIIRSLEAEPRGVYCGAIGVLAPPGSELPAAQFNVAIRTLVLDRASATVEYGTGGGITWDSQAAGEYEEAMLKAEVLTAVPPRFSLVETLRYTPPDGVARRPHHLARLAASAEYFGFPFDPDGVNKLLDDLSSGSAMAVRLLLAPDGDLQIDTAPVPEDEGSVRLAIDTQPIDPTSRFLFHKTTNRAVYEDAAARAPHADEVVLVNPDGNVTETNISNIAARFGETWLTPPIKDGCLPGAFRAEAILEERIAEASIAVDRLVEADEIAVFNSLRGWRSAVLP